MKQKMDLVASSDLYSQLPEVPLVSAIYGDSHTLQQKTAVVCF